MCDVGLPGSAFHVTETVFGCHTAYIFTVALFSVLRLFVLESTAFIAYVGVAVPPPIIVAVLLSASAELGSHPISVYPVLM